VLQHTLFTRPVPTPEQISTLLARLGALMGQDRIGAAATVDSYRPGAFVRKPFATDHHDDHRRARQPDREHRDTSGMDVWSALRRCRHPVPACVTPGSDGRPARVTTDRRGFAGGVVLSCAGPWRTSGDWWTGEGAHGAGAAGGVVRSSGAGASRGAGGWNRDEWDVALNDGAVYRIFRDRVTDAWFIDAIVD
jgi:protein ImuB